MLTREGIAFKMNLFSAYGEYLLKHELGEVISREIKDGFILVHLKYKDIDGNICYGKFRERKTKELFNIERIKLKV